MKSHENYAFEDEDVELATLLLGDINNTDKYAMDRLVAIKVFHQYYMSLPKAIALVELVEMEDDTRRDVSAIR